MKFKITLPEGETFEFINNEYKSLKSFIDNQLAATYYIIDPKNGIAIRCSNILKIEATKDE